MARLTTKQRAFIEQFFACGFNGTEAARLAGYKGNDVTLASVAYENLRKPHIAEVIDARLSEFVMSANEALARISEQATASMADFISLDKEGRPKLDLKQAYERGKLHLLKKIRVGAMGSLTIELHDPQKALKMIGQHHGSFVQKHEVDVPQLEPLTEVLEKALGKVYEERDD
jgi:phage terminase small subunit